MEKDLSKKKQESIDNIVAILNKMDLFGIQQLTDNANTLLLYQEALKKHDNDKKAG